PVSHHGAAYRAEMHVTGEQQVGAALRQVRHSHSCAADQVRLGKSLREIEWMVGHENPGEMAVEGTKPFADASDLPRVHASALPGERPCRIRPQNRDFVIDEGGLELGRDVNLKALEPLHEASIDIIERDIVI